MLEIWHGNRGVGLESWFMVRNIFLFGGPRFFLTEISLGFWLWAIYGHAEQPWRSLPRPRQVNIKRTTYPNNSIIIHLFDLQEQDAKLDSEWPLFSGKDLGHHPSLFNLKRGTGCHLHRLSSDIHPNWGGRQHHLRTRKEKCHEMFWFVPVLRWGFWGLCNDSPYQCWSLMCLTWWLMAVTTL